jgi:two-component system response regulator AtoC
VAPVSSPSSDSHPSGAPSTPPDERQRIIDALAACAGNQSRAAKVLGVSRRTLVARLDEYKIPRPKKSV